MCWPSSYEAFTNRPPVEQASQPVLCAPLRNQPRRRSFDVALKPLEECLFGKSRRDRIKDLGHNRAWKTPQRPARSEQAGIEGDRNGRHVSGRRKVGYTELVPRLCTGGPAST